MKNTLIVFFITVFSYANNDKYRLILVSDPATTITIAWNQISGNNPTVHYGTTDFGTNHNQYPNTQTVDRAIVYRAMNNRFVRLSGLSPNTNYYFVINDSEGNSDRFWFRTAPNDLSRLSFIAGGDSRNNRAPRRNANLLVSKLKPNAILFGGDMTDDDTNAQWQTWLDDWQLTTANDGRMFPILPAVGNHESANVIYNLFDTPTDDSYYAITFGNNLIRTYTLNTEISVSGNQLTWLENDLDEQNNVIWKAAQYHKPMRPHTSGKSEGQVIYNAWAQLFFEKGVRLVMDSDSHTVKTTWPIQPSSGGNNDEGFVRNDELGTVYAGEGCWGAPLRLNNDDKNWTRNSGSFNQFKLIFVSQSEIEMRTIDVNNASNVGEVSNTDPFTLPSNLNVWNPSQGDVVVISPIGGIVTPEIAFKNGRSTDLADGTDVLLEIDVIDPGNGIEKIDFFVNDILIDTDTQAPYNFINSYESGIYCVNAIVTNSNTQVATAKTYLNVGTFTDSSSSPISDGSNDVEETQTGVVYIDSGDLEMVYDRFDFVPDVPNAYQTIGFRFTNLNIPPGATIINSYIQFQSDEADSVPAEFNIFAEATGDASSFDDSSINNVSGRPRVSSMVNWIPAPWTDSGLTGPEQRTPELKGLLQQVIDQPDWEQGNSMVFIVEGAGESLKNPEARRVCDSYEGSSSDPATLVYSYSYAATLGVNEFPDAVKAKIFPNPFKSEFNIQVPTKFLENTTLEIFDVRGVSVYKKALPSFNGKPQIINPNLNSSGVYIAIISSKSGAVYDTIRIVKK